MKTKLIAVAVGCWLCLSVSALAGDRYHFEIDEGGSAREARESSLSGKSGRSKTSSTSFYEAPADYRRRFFEVNANESLAEGRLSLTMPFLPEEVTMGLNGVISSDDFFTVSIDAVYANRLLSESLTLGVGFRGIFGNMEKSDDLDANITAAGFMGTLMWDVPDIEVYYDRYLDLELGAELCVAPSPLTFGDTDRYWEGRVYTALNLSQDKRSSVMLGYRYLSLDFTTDEDGEWSRADEGFYFGYRFRF